MDKADDTRTPPKTRVEVVTVGETTVTRATFEPGWKWSEHVGPVAGTPSCQMHHQGYTISGHLRVVLDDGTEFDLNPGDAMDIPAGHDAWVTGDEPYVAVDFSTGTAASFAKG